MFNVQGVLRSYSDHSQANGTDPSRSILFKRDPKEKEYNKRAQVLGQPSNSELAVIYGSNDLKLIFNVAWQPL